MYIFQAETWCDSCGEQIRREIEPPADPGDEYLYDSDDYPMSAPEESCDGPDHCAAGAECLESIDLEPYGARSDELVGAEATRIGARVDGGLTEHGIEYLREMLGESPRTTYQRALHSYWREEYSDYLPYGDRLAEAQRRERE